MNQIKRVRQADRLILDEHRNLRFATWIIAL